MNGRRIWAVMSESFWILLVAIVALFAFLLALGAYSPGEVITLTIVMVVLFVLWVGHAVWVSRKAQRAGSAGDRGARAAGVLGRQLRLGREGSAPGGRWSGQNPTRWPSAASLRPAPAAGAHASW